MPVKYKKFDTKYNTAKRSDVEPLMVLSQKKGSILKMTGLFMKFLYFRYRFLPEQPAVCRFH